MKTSNKTTKVKTLQKFSKLKSFSCVKSQKYIYSALIFMNKITLYVLWTEISFRPEYSRLLRNYLFQRAKTSKENFINKLKC